MKELLTQGIGAGIGLGLILTIGHIVRGTVRGFRIWYFLQCKRKVWAKQDRFKWKGLHKAIIREIAGR